MKHLVAGLTALSLFAILPVQANAQSVPPELAKELTKKYSPPSRIVVEYTQNGVKMDEVGPFVAENFFNLSNAGPLGKPAKRVRKYCVKKQAGTFTQTAKILPNYALSQDPISFTDQGQNLSISAADIYFMSRTLNKPTGKKSGNDGWPESHFRKYEKLSREEKLGVFTCSDTAGTILWSVAIIPDQYYKRAQSILQGDVLWEKQISILPLNAETVAIAKRVKTSYNSVKANAAQDRADAQAKTSSEIDTFRATADVGMETTCGMIIQNRRPIFEVDLKSSVARASGKSTAWIKTDDLYPAASQTRCQIK